MLAQLRQTLKNRARAFFAARSPRSRNVELNQRRIYILPTPAGLIYGLLLTILLVAGINYQNNLIYALTFLLGTVFVLGTWYTYSNMAGLRFSARGLNPVFSGNPAFFSLRIEAPDSDPRFHLHISTELGEIHRVASVDANGAELTWSEPTLHRGYRLPERLTLVSRAPLGLFRCWAYLWLEAKVIVYPKPLSQVASVMSSEEQGARKHSGSAQAQEFDGFRPYREGDNRKQIHWPSYAKGQPMQTKEQPKMLDLQVWIDWDTFAGGAEHKLSAMCARVLELASQNRRYGIRLPGLSVAPDRGDVHRESCLRSLALFRLGESS